MASSRASSGRSKQFRLTLMRVAENLTSKDVQDVAFLCEDISPARREQLKDGTDLFKALQAHGLLDETRVDLLIGWLDDLKLLEASKLLKNYTATYPQSEGPLQEKCMTHEDLPVKYFCMTCNLKTCPECILASHGQGTTCEVIAMDSLQDEITSRRRKLITDLESLSQHLTLTNQLCDKRKASMAEERDTRRKEATAEYLAAVEMAEKRKRAVMEDLDRREISETREMLEKKKHLQSVESRVKSLREMTNDDDESVDYNVTKLQKLNIAATEAINIRLDIEKVSEMTTEQNGTGGEPLGVKTVDVTDGSTKDDGEDHDDDDVDKGDDDEAPPGCLIGSVSIESNQIINLSDHRKDKGGVLLVCVDPDNPAEEYWRHLVKTSDGDHPVVMSNIAVKYDFKGRGLLERISYRKHVLFAVGKTVYTVRLHWSGSIEDYVESATPLPIAEVPEGSWITSVTGCSKSKKQNEDEFVISFSGSSVLKEYGISVGVMRSIETKDYVSSGGIRSVAYVGDKFAIIEHGREDVVLISQHGGRTVTQCGTMRPPSTGLVPLSVLCVDGGTKWLVLFASGDETKRRWTVVSYDMAAKFLGERASGTANMIVGVPISIARRRFKGYATLRKDAIESFHIS